MSDLGNKKIMGDNISYYMKVNGKTRTDLANDLNLPYTTISDWINGNKYPRIDKIELLANYFGVEKSNLVEEKGKAEITPLDIIYDDFFPLHYSTNLSAGSLMELLNTEPDGIVYVPIKFQKIKKHLVAFKINGESMNRVFLNQSIIVVLKHSYSNEIYKNGTPVVVFINGNAFVKRFYFKDNQIILMPDSTEFHKPYIFDVKEMHDYIDHFQIIGKVVWYCPPDDVLEKK